MQKLNIKGNNFANQPTKNSQYGSQKTSHLQINQRHSNQSRNRSSSNSNKKSQRQAHGNGGQPSDSMTSHLMRFHDSNVGSTQFSAIKPAFLQNNTSQQSKINPHLSNNQSRGFHPHLASNITQKQSTRPMGHSKPQSQVHFHHMLESNDPSEYQNGGVLNNLMQLGNNQGKSQQSGARGSRFGESQKPSDSKLEQRVHNFINSNVSSRQQKSTHSNMPVSRIKMNFNPIQEDQIGEMNTSNNVSRQNGTSKITQVSQNKSHMGRPNPINSQFSEHPGHSKMSRGPNNQPPMNSNFQSK